MSKIPLEFYLQEDVVKLSQQLLGKLICTKIDGTVCKAIITETEAYAGKEDKASHAYGGRRTKRTEIMYAKGGISYVYLCYGIHFLFNIVSNQIDIPHAVLIRAIHPLVGSKEMLERRKLKVQTDSSFNGPAKVTQALGIRLDHNGIQLNSNSIWLEDHTIQVEEEEIESGPRIGIDYAEEDAYLPYRFVLKKELKKFDD